MNKYFIVAVMILGMFTLSALSPSSVKADLLNGHTVVLDEKGSIIPWTSDPSLAYDTVINSAWDYLLNRVPRDKVNGKPCYYSYSYLLPDTQEPYIWPHNPTGLYAMLSESALKYYGYSGNMAPVRLAQEVATALLDNGMTPGTWIWPNVPYASGDAGSLVYRGAAFGDVTGQGDGRGVIQPDKVGEMGYAWLQLYRFDGNTRFRDAAIMAANALARNIRIGNASQSPWPHRVYAETGVVRENYNADVIGPIRLFDGLINLGLGDTTTYRSARNNAWNWMMSYPMQNNIWSNYFEDDPIQPDLNNFDQYSAMMTARYLLEHPEYDANWEQHVRGLITWVEALFAEPAYGANSIAEQMIFHFPMGSHTSRYASVNALLYAATGDTAAREKAYRALNWATYMARPDGVVIDGPLVNNQWFTDGYGDYIRHFITSFGAIPEWVPKGQNHLVQTSSLIRSIVYDAAEIRYTTADSASTEVLKLGFVPGKVTVDGIALDQSPQQGQSGWSFDQNLMVLRVHHDSGSNIEITRAVASNLVSMALTPAAPVLSVGTTQQLSASGIFSDGSTGNIANATWSSSNSGVASISSSGLVTPLAPGTTVITAMRDGIVATASLTVQDVPPVVPGTATTIWPSTSVPAVVDAGLNSPLELGVRFRSDVSGSISGIRFYKSAANNGPHTVRLWTNNGTVLATALSTKETASGWQQADFAVPVPINANTVYIASYHVAAGHYSYTLNYFNGAGTDNSPLHAPADGVAGGNGVFAYGPAGTFPSAGWKGTSYWVDVSFSSSAGGDTVAPGVTSFAIPATSSTLSVPVTALSATDNAGVTGYLITELSTAPLSSDSRWSINAPTSYTFASSGSKTLYAWAKDAAGNISAGKSAVVTVTLLSEPSVSTLWGTAVPEKIDEGADDPVELGVKFTSQSSGYITGIRFYKAAANTGIHTGSLWASDGTLLARATFANETPSGWQEVTFSSPVPIAANQIYIASYFAGAGHYSCDQYYFTGKGVDTPPLHAPSDGTSGSNSVYAYGATSSFPNQSWRSANYWVDVMFRPLQ